MTGPSNSPRPPEGERASVSVHESRPQSSCRDENGDREVIELHEIETHEDDEPDLSTASLSSGEEYQVTTRTTHTVTRTTTGTTNEEAKGVWGSVQGFWTSHVILTVPQKANRDHFGTYVVCDLQWHVSSVSHQHVNGKCAETSSMA